MEMPRTVSRRVKSVSVSLMVDRQTVWTSQVEPDYPNTASQCFTLIAKSLFLTFDVLNIESIK